MNSKDYFESVAGEWDAIRQDFFSEAVRETALKFARLQPGMQAADIGAGNGFITEGLVASGVDVIAVDQSSKMLEVMANRFPQHASIEYRVGEDHALPVRDGEVDRVFANMFLHHVENPAIAIAEMTRILRPGGKLIITDLDEHNFEFLRTEQHDRWLGFNREDIRTWFAEAGLEDVVVDCVGENCRSASGAGDEMASVSIFVACGNKRT